MDETCLLAQIPIEQLRQDYFDKVLLKRILSVHGFKRYPDHLNLLKELQEIIGDDVYQVLVAVLDHLDKTHYIDNLERECPYIVEMIVDNCELFGNVETISETTSDQLLRIY